MTTVRKAEKLLPPKEELTAGARFGMWLRGERPEAGPRPVGDLLHPPEPHRIGICCSGGGIRSATYNLGVLQALDQEPADEHHPEAGSLLRSAQFLSAVSGGSYIASSFAMVGRYSDPELLAEQPAFAHGSPEEDHLRTHSSYLIPGAGGAAGLIRNLLLGMAVNLFLIGAALYVLANPLGWIYHEWLQPGLGVGEVRITGGMWVAVAVLAVPGAMASLASFVVRITDERLRRRLRAWGDRLLLAALVMLTILIVIPLVLEFVQDVLASGWSVDVSWMTAPGSALLAALSALGLTSMMLGAAKAFAARHRARIAVTVAAVAGPLGLVAVFLLFVNNAAAVGFSSGDWFGPAVVAAVLGLLYVVGDLMQWSLHPFYRRRLCTAFALHRVRDRRTGNPVCQELDYDKPVVLSKSQPAGFPELVVCAAANTSDPGVTPCGRNATSFTFTARKLGGPLVGYVATKEMEWAASEQAHRLTLPAVVAMSGAAISPSMGKQTRRSFTFLLAVANVRLGAWIPNPRWHGRLARGRTPPEEGWSDMRAKTFSGRRKLDRPRLSYLVKELFGWNRLNDRYLYVTDGGHYENLGLVELLRRGCTEIYVFDASGDDVDSFATLGEAIALARSDLLVDIDIDPTPLRRREDSNRADTDHVVGTFRYADGTEGRLVFAKTVVVDEAPWDVLAYAGADPEFPNHSTLDQLFDDAQFEAYRALGHSAGGRVAAAMRRAERSREAGRQAGMHLRQMGAWVPAGIWSRADLADGGARTPPATSG